VTIYAVTATISGETDIGADPNQLVAIKDSLSATSLPSGESFSVLEEADGLDVLRGVALFTQGAPANPAMVSASSVSAAGATLNAAVDPEGIDTTVSFQYGTSTAYGSMTATQDIGSGNSPYSYSPTLTGLQPGTTYDYRLVTVTNGVTTYYANQTFTTASASTGPATDTPTMPPLALLILATLLIGATAHSLKQKRQGIA
jgi:hypothetical protein